MYYGKPSPNHGWSHLDADILGFPLSEKDWLSLQDDLDLERARRCWPSLVSIRQVITIRLQHWRRSLRANDKIASKRGTPGQLLGDCCGSMPSLGLKQLYHNMATRAFAVSHALFPRHPLLLFPHFRIPDVV